MKTLINITLVASLAALTAQASVTTTNNVFNESYAKDAGTAGVLDGVGDSANNSAFNFAYAGVMGGSGTDVRKSFFNIDLPTSDGVNTLTSSANISNATLRIYYSGKHSNVNSDLSLYYETKSSITTVAADMYSTAWTDTGLGITTNDATGQYYELDVTSFVKASYDDVDSIASFRFETDSVTSYGTQPAWYRLGGTRTTGGSVSPGVPELVLTTVPEPSSFALLAGCFALTSIMVRRRR